MQTLAYYILGMVSGIISELMATGKDSRVSQPGTELGGPV